MYNLLWTLNSGRELSQTWKPCFSAVLQRTSRAISILDVAGARNSGSTHCHQQEQALSPSHEFEPEVPLTKVQALITLQEFQPVASLNAQQGLSALQEFEPIMMLPYVHWMKHKHSCCHCTAINLVPTPVQAHAPPLPQQLCFVVPVFLHQTVSSFLLPMKHSSNVNILCEFLKVLLGSQGKRPASSSEGRAGRWIVHLWRRCISRPADDVITTKRP